ncbi:MAG: twin-arginine translocase TatA/TatE family subunit [bacterium]|jgi:sec-independent protein translocase protein TatA
MNLPLQNEIFQTAGWLGTPEIIIIVIVIVLLFGGRKIPELMRGLGKGVKEFKEGIGDDDKKDDSKAEGADNTAK